MPKNHLVTEVLSKLNENQLALGAAIEELSKWVEQRGSVQTAENVRAALLTLDHNLDFIKLSLALLDRSE